MSAIAYVGKLALSAILPASVTAVASLSASLSAVEPVISADLSAAVAAEASITASPPNLAALVAEAQTIAIALAQAAAQVPPLPLVSFQAAALTSLVAELTPIVADLSAALALGVPLAALFVEAGVQAYSFSGTSSQLPALLPTSLPDGSGPKVTLMGFVLASTGGGTWAGMQTFFPDIPATQPAGTLVALGSLTIGHLVSLLEGGVTTANATLTAQLGSLRARLDGAIAASATVSATLPDVVTLAQQILSALQAPPASFITPTVAIAAMASLVASLTALVASLSAQVSALAAITSALATAGVLAFTYEGTGADFAGAVASAVGTGWPDGTPSSSASNALILLTSGTGTGAALSTLFGGL